MYIVSYRLMHWPLYRGVLYSECYQRFHILSKPCIALDHDIHVYGLAYVLIHARVFVF